jgi:hypothetical protein
MDFFFTFASPLIANPLASANFYEYFRLLPLFSANFSTKALENNQ